MDAVEPLQVRYRNTRGDMVLFQINRIFRSAINRIVFAIMGGIILLQHAEGFAYAPGQAAMRMLVQFGIIVVAVVVVTAFAVFAGISGPKNRAVLTEHVITLTDSGVVEQTEFNRSETYWRAIAGVERTSSYVHLFTTQLSAYIIPAAAFGSEDSLATFVSAAQQRIRDARQGDR